MFEFKLCHGHNATCGVDISAQHHVGMTVSLSSSLETWQTCFSCHHCWRADVDVGAELPLICVDQSLLVLPNEKHTLRLVSNFKPIVWNAAQLGVAGWPVPTSYRSELQILSSRTSPAAGQWLTMLHLSFLRRQCRLSRAHFVIANDISCPGHWVEH